MDENLAKAAAQHAVKCTASDQPESFHTKLTLQGNRALHVGKDSHIRVTTADNSSPYMLVAKIDLQQLICVLIEIEKSLSEV